MTLTTLRSRQMLHRAQFAGAVQRGLPETLSDTLNVRDFGATGDGVTDDSAALQACISAAQAGGKGVLLPDGVYAIPTLGTQSGRLFLEGRGNATLKGTLTYEQAFTASADTATPLTPGAPYLQVRGLNFQAVGALAWGLVFKTSEQTSFLSTFTLADCRFFGDKGMLARYAVGFQLQGCEFNNRVAGARFESCTNGSVLLCRFQNQAESGVYITSAAGASHRAGGENLKFSLCEWAVCTYGIIADQHRWLVIADCLLDYCALPLFLGGCNNAKASNSYFGASNVAVSRFSGVPGYLAPNASGAAAFLRPGGLPVGNLVVGLTAHNCEFVNYVSGTGSPIVHCDGYIDAIYPLSGEKVSFIDCLFLASTNHVAGALLWIKAFRFALVVGCTFHSYNVSSALQDAYRIDDTVNPLGHSNDFQNCTQAGVPVRSRSEKMLASVYVQANDPGYIGAGNIWVQP